MIIKQTQFPDPERSASAAAIAAADPRGAGVSPAIDGFQQITEGNSPAQLRRFSFISTSSLRETFNRRVLQLHICNAPGAGIPARLEDAPEPMLSLAFITPLP
ncbi:MAG: hypothetical protein ACR2IE_20390 [Candidatus Sumerlaeaceae bacterium]